MAIMGSKGKESACNAGDLGGEANVYSLLYSCVENSMDTGAWWSIVHAVTKSQAQLND